MSKAELVEDYCIRAGRVHPWATEAGTTIKFLKAEIAKLRAAYESQWLVINQRRCFLIQKKIKGFLTDIEVIEFNDLQRLADERQNLIAPFDFEKLEKVCNEITKGRSK